jgi:hypothetical protein
MRRCLHQETADENFVADGVLIAGIRHALGGNESDFVSRFRRPLQVLEGADEDPILIITKEKVDSIAACECAGVALAGSSRGKINIVPVEPVLFKMRDHFGQRSDALCVRDFIQYPLHHCQIPVRGENAGLDKPLLADNLEVKLIAKIAAQLADELPLRLPISFSEWVD